MARFLNNDALLVLDLLETAKSVTKTREDLVDVYWNYVNNSDEFNFKDFVDGDPDTLNFLAMGFYHMKRPGDQKLKKSYDKLKPLFVEKFIEYQWNDPDYNDKYEKYDRKSFA